MSKIEATPAELMQAMQDETDQLRSHVEKLSAENETFRADNERHLMAVHHAEQMIAAQIRDLDLMRAENEKLKAKG